MSGVYVHIPFCRQSCIYCNFYFKTGIRQSEQVHQSLLQEIELKSERLPDFIETIYFGGGTPSFIEPEKIREVIDKLRNKRRNSNIIEITLEANPDDMSKENLKKWKDMGVNRLSVGIQSFHDQHLRWMNRAHSASEALHALELAGEIGFEMSVDLIFGIPESTDEQWIMNLKTALNFNIVHLSCYALTLEERTPWKKLIDSGKYKTVDNDLSASQFGLTMEILKENNWWHYEISNYCKPGKMAVHNTSYWQRKSYLGLGPSAHSYDGITRFWNVSDINLYVESIQKRKIAEESELLTEKDKLNEYIMTSLRTMWGMDFNILKENILWNRKLKGQLENQIEIGNLVLDKDKILLSDSGKYFADAIAAELFI